MQPYNSAQFNIFCRRSTIVADAATARADLAEALLARRDARYARARRILRALKLALDGGALAAAVLFVGVALWAVVRRRAGS